MLIVCITMYNIMGCSWFLQRFTTVGPFAFSCPASKSGPDKVNMVCFFKWTYYGQFSYVQFATFQIEGLKSHIQMPRIMCMVKPSIILRKCMHAIMQCPRVWKSM